MIEEVRFSLAGGATRQGAAIIDSRDWAGSGQADFGDRRTGFPLLDVAVLAPGNINIVLNYAIVAVPGAEPPVLTFSARSTTAVVGAAWGFLEGQRITARFARLDITDTSGVANNNIYLVYFVRGA